MSDYATLGEFKAVYAQSLDAPDEPAIREMLAAASRAIDGVTKREADAFAPSPLSPTALKIFGEGESCLVVPQHVKGSITGVTTIEGLTAPLFIEFRTRLCVVDADGVMLRNEVWRNGVPYFVTARWGYDVTPADIKQACMKLVDFWWHAKGGAVSGTIGNLSTDGRLYVSDDYPESVKRLLQPYVLQERESSSDGVVEFGDLINKDFTPGRY